MEALLGTVSEWGILIMIERGCVVTSRLPCLRAGVGGDVSLHCNQLQNSLLII